MAPENVTVRCCIAGGGPAGMMLGLLLARAGVSVLVLEKHADFLRDFRGDTLHPSTLEIMHELGLLDRFLRLPHQPVSKLVGHVGDFRFTVADFSGLPTRCRYIAFMPQWDFLNFLAEEGSRYSTFQVRMNTEVTDVVQGEGGIVGVSAEHGGRPVEIRADLVIGADGRHSTVRAKAGLEVEDLGAPMDVLWFRLSRHANDPSDPMGRFDAGRVFILINRGDYWQCGFVIAKGTFDALRAQGLEAFRRTISGSASFLGDRVGELREWAAVKLLTVRVDRLPQWYRPGLLCIGDAAHAMSPVGGVGINLAIQDAVAAANLLAVPLRDKRLTTADLRGVQDRRKWPADMTQRAQLLVQKRIITPTLAKSDTPSAPFLLRLYARLPFLHGIPARVIGLGVRPEHVDIDTIDRRP